MRKRKEIPSQELLKSLFDYSNGRLIWKVSGRGKKAGSVAGFHHTGGYRRISIESSYYAEHRVIYSWHHGPCPEEVDHIDRVRDNNKIENLRASNRSSNTHNTGFKPNCKSGCRGVHYDNYQKAWRIAIFRYGKRINLGRSHDFFEACCIRKRAELKHPDY